MTRRKARDPVLNVACPTCYARAGQPCKSYRDIPVHKARREALDAHTQRWWGKLAEEEIEAGRSPAGGFTERQLAAWGVPWPPPKGWRHRLVYGDGSRPRGDDPAVPSKPVVMGRTGTENVIPETAEYWPPWEKPPVPGCMAESLIPVSGLVWCPAHKEYEELRDGIPGVRLRLPA